MKIFTAAIAVVFSPIIAFCAAFYEIDRNFADKPFIYSPEDALRAYKGEWEGGQEISVFKGDTVAMLKVEQSYRQNLDGSLDCVVTAYSKRGKVAERKSRIYVEDDFLVLEEYNPRGALRPAYLGSTKSGEVVWNAYYPFAHFDRQTDRFVGVGEYANIMTEGMKYEKIPQLGFNGLMQIRGVFSKKKRFESGLPRTLNLRSPVYSN